MGVIDLRLWHNIIFEFSITNRFNQDDTLLKSSDHYIWCICKDPKGGKTPKSARATGSLSAT